MLLVPACNGSTGAVVSHAKHPWINGQDMHCGILLWKCCRVAGVQPLECHVHSCSIWCTTFWVQRYVEDVGCVPVEWQSESWPCDARLSTGGRVGLSRHAWLLKICHRASAIIKGRDSVNRSNLNDRDCDAVTMSHRAGACA